MGILVPDDFPLSQLKNDDERRVVRAFLDRLSDNWVVIPDVDLVGRRDHQLDVVLAHPDDGVAVVEVKGHRPQIRAGIWYAHGSPMAPQPVGQARDNAYELRRRLRAASPALADVRVEHAVAFPNLVALDGDLPPGIDTAQVLTRDALDDPRDAIDRLVTFRSGTSRLGPHGLQAVLDVLRPSVELVWDPEARARHARRRLEQISADQTRALESLDLNRRVCVTGGAGTGKTRLADAWARRAAQRGERVLVTCFNEPLADVTAGRLDDLEVTVGNFHHVARTLDGMPPLEVPDDADGTWWDTVMTGHLVSNWPHVVDRYDTIIVDEAQDFSLVWLTLLEQLLDTDGARRMMLLADTSQTIYERGFAIPDSDEGWARCQLVDNCRNTSQIAALLHRRLGGARISIAGPESEAVHFVEIDDDEAAVGEVGEAIDVILDERDHTPETMLVCTTSSAMRDRLIDEYAFTRWEDRSELTIVCENVHRSKGLEFDHVVMVTCDHDPSDELLYVGASRAVISLTVIAPAEVTARLVPGRIRGS